MNTTYWRQNLKFLRGEMDINQTQLGLQVNKTQKTIANWETGVSEPNIDEVAKITQYFGITVDDFYFTDMSKGKVIENEKNNLNGKVKGKVRGKVSSNDAGFSELEELKKELAVKEAIIASKDEIIAHLKLNIDDLRETRSILSDEIALLKRELDGLQKQISGHSGQGRVGRTG